MDGGVLYCTVLYCTVLYCTARAIRNTVEQHSAGLFEVFL